MIQQNPKDWQQGFWGSEHPETAALRVQKDYVDTMIALKRENMDRVYLYLTSLLDKAKEELGLARSELHSIVHGFCEDLLATAHGNWSDACRVSAHTLYSLLAEIDEPALRRRLLAMCTTIVDADRHVADGESLLLAAAADHWGLANELLPPPPATALPR